MDNRGKIARRNFLKHLGCGALMGYCPNLYAETSTTDVQFLHSNHRLFEQYRQLFNKRINLLPAVIAVCSNETGVRKAVDYANSKGLSINIKSGGHSFEGFSLNQDGLVIDLSKMNKLVLDSNHQLTAEPAVRLAQLYDYCFSRGRLLPSGSCGTVGLAGITLGGGYGLFSRQYGLTSDYLTGVRMIDADGRIIDSDDLPELLWGCRGGGNGNFGVITQLRYDTVPAPRTLYQHRFRSFKLEVGQSSQLAQFWFDQCQHLPLHAYSAFILNGKTLTIMFTATAHDDDMATILSAFDRRMDKNAGLKPDPIKRGVRYYYGHGHSLYFKNMSAGYYKEFDDIGGCLEKLLTVVGNTPGMLLQINSLGGAINHEWKNEHSAYPHRSFHFLGEAQCYWNNPDEEKRSMEAMKSAQQILYQNGVRQHYVNYPDININHYEQAYYGKSYKRLQRLKRSLDPNHVFSYAQSVKPD